MIYEANTHEYESSVKTNIQVRLLVFAVPPISLENTHIMNFKSINYKNIFI